MLVAALLQPLEVVAEIEDLEELLAAPVGHPGERATLQPVCDGDAG
jgi:hypothetical protein